MIKKIIAGLMLTLTISVLVPAQADAAWLKTSDNTWKYEQNGENLTGWNQINNLWYNFSVDGTMQTGWIKGNNNDWYYCWSDGSMAQNSWLTNGGFWYYFDNDGKLVTNTAKVGENTYYFNVPSIIASTDLGIKFDMTSVPSDKTDETEKKEGTEIVKESDNAENISENTEEASSEVKETEDSLTK